MTISECNKAVRKLCSNPSLFLPTIDESLPQKVLLYLQCYQVSCLDIKKRKHELKLEKNTGNLKCVDVEVWTRIKLCNDPRRCSVAKM